MQIDMNKEILEMCFCLKNDSMILKLNNVNQTEYVTVDGINSYERL